MRIPGSQQGRAQRAGEHPGSDSQRRRRARGHGQRGQRRQQLGAVGHQQAGIPQFLGAPRRGQPLIVILRRRQHGEPEGLASHTPKASPA